MPKKPSFFDRLTGATAEDDSDVFEERAVPATKTTLSAEEGEAQLTVDVYQTPDLIVIRALVAGVRPEDLDISITRDMVTISGKRVENREVEENDYVYRELFWGSFSRTVVLPAEVDVDLAEASEKHGLLTIKLPKVNKDRQTKLKVRGS